jgi:hypothetical protein
MTAITAGGESYPSLDRARAALSRRRDELGNYYGEHPCYLRSGADFAAFKDAADAHPERNSWPIGEISTIRISRNPCGGGYGVWAIDDEGESQLFSLKNCWLTRKAPPATPDCPSEAQVTEQMRHAVKEQVIAFAREQQEFDGTYRCCLCSEHGLERKQVEVDHHPLSFDTLHLVWLVDATDGEPISAFALDYTGAECSAQAKFKDPIVQHSWQLFHQLHAGLRILCKPCHNKWSEEQKQQKPN